MLITEFTEEKRIKSFVFEYSLDNLEQCGSSKEDLDYLEWLNQFKLFRLDEQTGEIQPLDSIESFPFLEGTVFGQQKGLSINTTICMINLRRPWILSVVKNSFLILRIGNSML